MRRSGDACQGGCARWNVIKLWLPPILISPLLRPLLSHIALNTFTCAKKIDSDTLLYTDEHPNTDDTHVALLTRWCNSLPSNQHPDFVPVVKQTNWQTCLRLRSRATNSRSRGFVHKHSTKGNSDWNIPFCPPTPADYKLLPPLPMVSILRPPETTFPDYDNSNRLTMASAATYHGHSYTEAMQEYMDLQFIRNELCVHLDQLRPGSLSAVTSNSSNYSSPATSPTRSSSSSSSSSRRRHSRSGERRHHKAHARCSGWDDASETLHTIPDEETLEEISVEEKRLFDVDESIKRALTELLNCEGVRHDRSMRLWVQSRLMETEKELRSGRRRRSSE